MKITEVSSREDLKKFIELPYRLYRNDPKWIPPIKKDEWKYWTQHPGLKTNKIKLFLVKDTRGNALGRLAYLVNRKYNELNNTKTVRFHSLEAVNDPAVFDKLFEAAENEARRDGMELIHGPLGYNNLDHQGLQVEGFEHPQILVSTYNFPYYKDHLERLGYTKEIDWIENRITITDEPVQKGKKGAELVKRRFGITAFQPSSKKELISLADNIFTLYNKAYSHLPYMVPLSEEEIDFYKKSYLQVLLPEWSFFARDEKNGKTVGFMLAMPSLGDALRKAKGKLFPFGFIHILKALRKPKEIDIGIIGVHPDYFNKGVAAVIFNRFHEQMLKHGIRVFETGGVFEINHNVLSNWKNYEHEQNRRKRVYGKKL